MSDFSAAPRVAVPGSRRDEPAGAIADGPVDPRERADVSVLVRGKTPVAAAAARLATQPPAERTYLTRAGYAEAHGADPADLGAVAAFARTAGLEVGASDVARRTLELSGSVAALAAAFGANLSFYRWPDGTRLRVRVGELTIPATLAGIVTGVFGLDERPQARAQFVRAAARAAADAAGLSPVEIANAYGFPASDGAGQTIALIELGGGYVPSDLTTYFGGLGLPVPTVTSVAVDGGANAPTGDANGPDAEVALDIEVAGAVAPGAKIVVYFAPNTDRGFLDAVTTAVHDTVNAPTILSISWGGPESTWTAQATTNFDAAFAAAATLGITVAVAAGDGGSSDGVTDGKAHVDFPASSPHVLACGGTRLTIASGSVASETVWNDGSSGGATGGGISDVFAVPSWQATAKVPPSANPGAHVGRGVPDVSANADPQTGYRTLVDGTPGVIGGTSAAAPLWAGLVARLNARASRALGFLNATLYASPTALRDVTSGDNGAYAAGPGWDACSGLGSPDGAALGTLFR